MINEGTRQNPVFGEPQRIQAAGRPIRLLRNELLGPPDHPHNMGYPYPVFADWDADGRPDLVVPNETNRLYWYRNTGTRQHPQFAERRQILCDGFPDSAEMKSRSNRRANDAESNNGAYPYENERPFFWRTGAAVADFTGDGLADLITLDGQTRSAVLFEQYRGEGGVLRLRKGSILRLTDGRPITDRIVDRRARWTESFRPVDWDQDGRLDLIYSVAGSHAATKDGGSIYLLRNEGTLTAPVFAPPRTMRCFGEPIRISDHGPHPWAGDLDGDGLPDLVACTEWSVYPWYSHAALMMPQHPEYTLRLQPAP